MEPEVPHSAIVLESLRAVIRACFGVGEVLRSKQVVCHATVRAAHPFHAEFRQFNAVAAKVMRKHADELGIVYLQGGDAAGGGAFWQRVA